MCIIYKLISKITVFIMILGLLILQTACSGSNNGNNQNNGSISLQTISITPSNSFTHLGINQQFIATGIYSNGLKKNITTQVQWNSSNPSSMSISNLTGTQGLAKALSVNTSPIIITASLNNVSASTNFSVSSAVLKSVIISSPNSIIHLGINQQYTAIGVYADGSTQDISLYVSWKSSNPNIATISSSGLIIPVAPGSVNISATTLSSLSMAKPINLKNVKAISSISNVSVSSAPVQSVSILQSNPTIHLGTVMQLSATAIFADQNTQNISNNTIWTSSNTGVATVDSTGLVTPIANGSSTVTAMMYTSSGAVFSNTVSLNISNAPLTSITVTPTNTTSYQGIPQQFSAIGIFSDGSQDVTIAANWNSSNANIATINNTSSSISGLVQPSLTVNTTANTNISASLTNNGSVITSPVTVLTISTATLSSISIIPPSTSIPKGVTQQYTAMGTFSDGSTKDITTAVIWSSENSTLINISNTLGANGLATAGISATGVTNINATLNGITSRSAVNITNATLKSINITPSNSLIGIGASFQYNAIGTFSDSSTLNLNSSVIWSSSNTAIATISNTTGNNGYATGIGLGSVTVSATFNTISASTLLSVSNAVLQSINISPNLINGTGSTQPFTAIGVYSDGTQQNITNSVVWSESNTSIITISNTIGSQGLATAINLGSTVTTAILGTISGNISVSVIPYAYIINNTGTTAPTTCTLNANTGALPVCASSGGTGFNNSWALAINNGFAYITNTAANNVNVCNISNGTLSNCTTTGSSLSSPRGIAISNGYAYITNSTGSTVTSCAVNAKVLSSCSTTGSGFNIPYGITINNGYAYITNNTGNTVSYCVVNSGTLSSCATTGSGFTLPSAITINNGLAYVVNSGPTNTVLVCTVNSNGTLTGCVDSGVGAIFNNPFGIAINNGIAYIVNANGGGSVSQCTINTITGAFSSCTNSGATGFATPTVITFY